ncbi:MAG: hypothetical protein WAP51_05000 [Candidatus Sungiibacteriota bacterium]
MKYKDEVPRKKQIRLNQFRLLPGDMVRMKYRNDYADGVVKEVWSANPEYVLNGPKAEDAGVIHWTNCTKNERRDCEAFLRGGHRPVKIRLYKSMWAVIKLYPAATQPFTVTLYTYDIEELCRKGEFIIYRGLSVHPMPNHS